MKNRIYSSLLIALFFVSVANSQELKWGAIQQSDPKENVFPTPLKVNSDGVLTEEITSAGKKESMNLKMFGWDGLVKSTKDVWAEDNTVKDKPNEITTVFEMKKNLVLVENGDLNYYAYKVGFDGTVSMPGVLIGDVDSKVKYAQELQRDNYYHFALSSDTLSFLAFYHPYKSTKVVMKIYDEDLKVINNTTIDFPYMRKDVESEMCFFNGEHAIFFIHLNEERSNQPNFILLVYDFKTGTLKKLTLDVVGKGNTRHAGDALQKIMTPKGDFIISTVYSTDNSNYPVGLYYVSIAHNSSDFKVNKSIQFPEELLAQFTGDKKAENGKGIEGLYLKSFYNCPDGSLVFAAEVHSEQLVDYYGACLIGKISPEGNFVWIKKIAKKQTVNYMSGVYSYFCAVSKDKVYVLFNDRKENLNIDREQANKDESILKAAYCSQDKDACYLVMEEMNLSDGTMKQTCISKPDEGSDYLTFHALYGLTQQVDANNIMMYRSNKSHFQIGFLKID